MTATKPYQLLQSEKEYFEITYYLWPSRVWTPLRRRKDTAGAGLLPYDGGRTAGLV